MLPFGENVEEIAACEMAQVIGPRAERIDGSLTPVSP